MKVKSHMVISVDVGQTLNKIQHPKQIKNKRIMVQHNEGYL